MFSLYSALIILLCNIHQPIAGGRQTILISILHHCECPEIKLRLRLYQTQTEALPTEPPRHPTVAKIQLIKIFIGTENQN